MPGRQVGRFALRMFIAGVCLGNSVLALGQVSAKVYPDAGFLEYLASLEEIDGEWFGPEDMQYLQETTHAVREFRSELPVLREPAQLSPEQEEAK